jgi:hypothetical protein
MGLHLKGITVIRMKAAALQAGAEVYDAVRVQGHAAVAKSGAAASSAAKDGLFRRHGCTLKKDRLLSDAPGCPGITAPAPFPMDDE